MSFADEARRLVDFTAGRPIALLNFPVDKSFRAREVADFRAFRSQALWRQGDSRGRGLAAVNFSHCRTFRNLIHF